MRDRGRTFGGATGGGGCNLRTGRRRARMGRCEAAAEENGEADLVYWLYELLAPKEDFTTHVILMYLHEGC
jgi:hypothetical protein